jgi:uncharacterized protein (TIGR02611 family)
MSQHPVAEAPELVNIDQERSRRARAVRIAKRWTIGVAGGVVILTGLALVPLPGPGWLIVFLGLGLLATEFDWAERLLHRGREQLRRWTDWVQRQPLILRLAIGAVGLAFTGAVVYTTLLLYGALPAPLQN